MEGKSNIQGDFRDGIRTEDGKVSFKKVSLSLRQAFRRNTAGELNMLRVPGTDDGSSSYGTSRRGSIMPGFGRFGLAKKPKTTYEPTYKMDPDDKPDIASMKLILEETVLQCSEKITWPEFHKTKALLRLNNLLHRKIKAMMPKRYRFVLQVMAFEPDQQDAKLCSSFLWNGEHDTYLTYKFEKFDLTVVSILHLIYIE
ncbi:Oidioi.mRNA.OKI2018_I69.PAR.g9550.t1.cds [Oikopleura dioica]|uniref:Oidioi.mRNA.OKI2018_I69.PAR.g9550.t1.cds n=1 Tax=Oikopleura dioica TaxID=34765 RepID=A0ABN7RQN9_OIKDI|nr:Oidioi.mRNA.OKI2018_I69.PAR.g9550.t1.cds [Oikopleura dioica]